MSQNAIMRFLDLASTYTQIHPQGHLLSNKTCRNTSRNTLNMNAGKNEPGKTKPRFQL